MGRFGAGLFEGEEARSVSGRSVGPVLCQREGDLLHILCCGGQQTLASDPDERAEARIAMAVQLLGVGEGTLHRLLAPFVDRLR